MKDKIIKYLEQSLENIGFISSMSPRLKIPMRDLESSLNELIKEGKVRKVIVPCTNTLDGVKVYEDQFSYDLNKTPDDFEILNDIDFEPYDSMFIELHIAYKLVSQ